MLSPDPPLPQAPPSPGSTPFGSSQPAPPFAATPGGTNTVAPYFNLPAQKQQWHPQPSDDDSQDESEPLLLASNDPSFLPARSRSTPTAATAPPGDFVPLAVVASVSEPPMAFDHGFLDDGHGNIDDSKRRAPTASDRVAYAKWQAKAMAASTLRPDLFDAVRFYGHFMGASGTDLSFSYDKFVASDSGGKTVLQSAIQDVSAAAITQHESRGMRADTFTIQSQAIGVGGGNERYPYPDTENWQKTIGAHVTWLEAIVNVLVGNDVCSPGVDDGSRSFTISMTLHAADMYNFNPGDQDIVTGIPDNENGIFEITGLAKEFKSVSTLLRTISFSAPLSHVADPTVAPSDRVVTTLPR